MVENKNVDTQWSGENWKLYQADCCDATKGLPDDSVDFCIHSPPFSSLYIYSQSTNDLGNATSDDEFFDHYCYLIPELLRVTVPGRLCVVHCKDLPKYRNRDGAAGLTDFPGMIIRAFEECGWTYHSRCTIWKCPVIEMQRTKNHGLLHKQLCKDSSASRQGMADYLLVFRKWGGWDGAEPPKSVRAESQSLLDDGLRFDSYVGSLPPGSNLRYGFTEMTGLTCEVLTDKSGKIFQRRQMSIQVWQRYASPVWFDINQTRVLNYRQARSESDEKHICPLQLDVIDRAIHLWTNPNDIVLSPFAGIGSEGYGALSLGRKFIGIELKDSYCKQAVKNLKQAEQDFNQREMPLLFQDKESENVETSDSEEAEKSLF